MARFLPTFVLFVAMLIAGAVEGAPVRVSQIDDMIDDGVSPAQVIEMMREYGVGFRMSNSVERRLKSYGFTEDQIQTVKNIIDGTDVPPAPPEAPAEGPGEGEPGAPMPGEVEPGLPGVPGGLPGAQPGADNGGGEFGVGWAMPEAFHPQEKLRVERAVAAALGYERHELSRVTLYCNARRARRLVPMLRELEAKLIATFPKSLVNACDPRSTHIVIVDGASEWNNWVDACFASYEKDGITYSFGPEANSTERLKAGSGYMLPHLAAVHADKISNDEMVARFAAYDVGHLMMNVAAGSGGPDGLVTGFGGFTEAMVFGTPSVTVYSYVERDNQEQMQSWLQTVQQRFRNREITTAHHVWNYSTDEMVSHQYAEAWSLVTTLCQAPEKFAAAVLLVKQGKSMAEAVEEVYGLDERKLLEAWFRYVNQ